MVLKNLFSKLTMNLSTIPERHHNITLSFSSYETPWNYNSTDDSDFKGSDDFFLTYFSPVRFSLECALVAVALACNIFAFLMNHDYSYQHFAYHTLYKNLTIANSLATLTSWMSNNSVFLFSKYMWDMGSFCHTMELLFYLNMLCMVFGLASGITIVGFGGIHYLSICWPLRYDSFITKPKILAGIFGLWVTSTMVASITCVAYAGITYTSWGCSIFRVEEFNKIGSTTTMSLLAVCHVTLCSFCLRIYSEIRKLQERLSQYMWDDELQYERRAFYTILLLLITMSVFFIPYGVVFVITLNAKGIDLTTDKALLYYMNLLPYLKYATDPVIYGKRMLGLHEQLRKHCHKKCCAIFPIRRRTSSTPYVREDNTRKGQLYQMVTLV